ncbi:MAG: hypothetical protein PHU61_00015 [Candidatus Absconditabacteria bacterium]|nr:hypothetical protein [Candidatus Absconditabacteria bacterium]MDD4714209.1 hypothetical protein [Candidatus Absconditabacteria bacterium]
MEFNKKQALIKILGQLVGYWSLAEGFLLLLKEVEDERLADELLDMIYEQVKKIEDKEKQHKLREQIKMLKQHNKIMEADRKTADELLDSLLDILDE